MKILIVAPWIERLVGGAASAAAAAPEQMAEDLHQTDECLCQKV